MLNYCYNWYFSTILTWTKYPHNDFDYQKYAFHWDWYIISPLIAKVTSRLISIQVVVICVAWIHQRTNGRPLYMVEHTNRPGPFYWEICWHGSLLVLVQAEECTTTWQTILLNLVPSDWSIFELLANVGLADGRLYSLFWTCSWWCRSNWRLSVASKCLAVVPLEIPFVISRSCTSSIKILPVYR